MGSNTSPRRQQQPTKETSVVSGKNNVRLASSDILLPGPFKQMDVIQEERVEAVTKTIDGVKNKSTKATTPDKGNIINNGEQGEGVEKEDSIQDKSPTDKLPPRVPSLTGLQDEMTKKFEIVAIKMVAGRGKRTSTDAKKHLVSPKRTSGCSDPRLMETSKVRRSHNGGAKKSVERT